MPSDPPTTREFSIVLLGGGAVALELHLPALRRLGALERVRVVEPSAAILERVRRQFPEATSTQLSFESYLDAGPEHGPRTLALVAVPNHLHAAAVEGALRRGMHVLCEKPLALDAATCLRLHELSVECDRTLAVGMVRRLLPSVSALRSALEAGLIGSPERLYIAHGGAYGWPAASKAPFERRNGGVLADMGIHYLDLAEHLFGPLEPVIYEDDCRGGVEANCSFELRARGGLPVQLTLSRTHALANTLQLDGTEGSLELQVDAFDGCSWRTRRGLHGRLAADRPFTSGDWPATFASAFVEQLERTTRQILEGAPPAVSGADAARTVRSIEWAYAQRPSSPVPATCAPARPSLRPAPVVVTGATGFIGQHLVERLVQLGFDSIRAPVRSYGSCAGVARFPVDLERVDLLDPQQVTRSLRGARHVFHLAYGRDGADAARVTVTGTQNVVEAAIAAGVESVVVLSTMYVFGHPDADAPLDESAAYRPAGGDYGETKARMEKWCLQRAKDSGSTRIVVLNPSCVYGPGGGAYTELPARLATRGEFGWVDNGRGVANYNYVDNLVDAIVLAASVAGAHGQRFLITDGACTWREFLAPILGPLAAGLQSFTVRDLETQPGAQRSGPGELLRHLAGDLELIDIVNRMPVAGTLKRRLFKQAPRVRGALVDLRKPPSGASAPDSAARPHYPPRWIAGLYGPTRTLFKSDKARSVLGWHPLVSLADGQQRAAHWLEATGVLPPTAT